MKSLFINDNTIMVNATKYWNQFKQMCKFTDCYISIGAHRGGTEGGVLGEG